MAGAKQRKAIKDFVEYWLNKPSIKEKQDCHPFWLSLLRVLFNIENPEMIVDLEKEVKSKTKKYIDVYIPSTRVLIEQKSPNIDLNKAYLQSDGSMLTPYEQARNYIHDMNILESPLKVITCNFNKFCVYYMTQPNNPPEEILLKDLEKEYYRLEFLVDTHSEHIRKEEQLSLNAGEIVGLLYDAFLEQYIDKNSDETLKSLNKLCVRLVFCLYAEDAGIFGKRDMFLNYMKQYPTKEMRDALIRLFKVLNTKKRDPYLNEDLAAFPYVNGGLFADEDIKIPQFTDEIRDLLLIKASEKFDWSEISPTIFGAVFESTLNPETRHSGGMHYTSIENIHKVIDPLFLKDLKQEFNEICCYKNPKTLKENLSKFQGKIANLTFLDPACGSGNFLTETYISLRKLENEIIDKIGGKNQTWLVSPVKVSINQFYGIEINDFAVTVAQTALWIAESQMLKETENIINHDLNFLPLTSNSNIVEGNALRLNWETIIPKAKLNYIMGNPPFVGAREKSKEQAKDLDFCMKNIKNYNNLDYVSAWYKIAADYIKDTNIRVALVSTNSITQGIQPSILFEYLFNKGFHIDYAYKTFRWDSEANIKAHVHCVIIGFSYSQYNKEKVIYEKDKKNIVKNINGYLLNADSIFVYERTKPIQDIPEIVMGSMPNDDNGLLSKFSKEEMNKIVSKYPTAKNLFKRFMGAKEFIHNKERYCLWLKDISPKEYQNIKPILDIIQNVKHKRESSNRPGTQQLAKKPHLFGEIRQPSTDYLIVPCHSSENRKYIPIDYVHKNIICSNANMLIAEPSLYCFGILNSTVHMTWVKTVCGRIKSDYRYSNTVVYNNFPWCMVSEEQKAKIEKTALGILNARKLYPECSLADMYDHLELYIELYNAHEQNDKAVMEAYGFRHKNKNGKVVELSETEIIIELFKMYQKLTQNN